MVKRRALTGFARFRIAVLMKRVRRLWAVGAASFLLFTWAVGCDRSALAPEPPKNLIIITFDTLRAGHVGAYGYDRDTTPNLDAFASESVVFEKAYSQAASTVPALSSLMTSRYPHQTGVLETYKYAVPEDEITLAERMKDNGFETAAILGIGVLMPTRRMDQGFDHYSYTLYTNKQYWKTAAEITDEAVEWLGGNRERPFFLWVHYFEPHQPYDVVPQAARDRFLDVPSSHPLLDGVKPGSPHYMRVRNKIDAYDGALSHADSEFGRLLGEMRKLDLLENSMIVVSADHGETLGEHGQHGHVFGLWEQVIRIPLFIRLPNVRPARVAGRVQHVDVVPTVVREMGLSVEETPPFEGQALPLSRSDDKRFWVREKLEPRDSFAETWYRNHRAASMVTERWKFILDQPHDGTAARTWLFDLDADPLEEVNLVGKETAVAEALEARLRTWMNEDFQSPDVIGKKGGELEMLKALGYVD
jgi:arylsulfatase